MARKNLLEGLMNEALKGGSEPDTESARVNPARPRYTTGAIGAVSQSIADLKTRAVVEIDPDHIEDSGVRDRLDYVEAENAALMESIRKSGQQVPILVRPHPDKPNRFQIIYGRRRVFAARDLGIPVKALVRTLDDEAAIVAQGQENAARKDLSFVEKANFARQMRDLGYDRAIICDTLHVDKTVVSRMLSVMDTLPLAVVEAIGAAPAAGRDRWIALARLIKERDWSEAEMLNLCAGDTSDARFNALTKALSIVERRQRTVRPPRPSTIKATNGEPLARIIRTEDRVTVNLALRETKGFEDWLIANLPELHRTWKTDPNTGQDGE